MANRSHKTFFMPLLCRSAQNEVVQPAKVPPRPPSADPSSPKITCIGQMKKKSTTTTITTNHRFYSGNEKSHVHSNRYTLFSSKNLISPAAMDTASIKHSKRSKSCNGRSGRSLIRSKRYYTTSSDDHDIVRVVVREELDPPLPVVKCGRDQEANVNLWKRRGIEMKTLQIQPIQLMMNQNSCGNNAGFSLSTSATMV